MVSRGGPTLSGAPSLLSAAAHDGDDKKSDAKEMGEENLEHDSRRQNNFLVCKIFIFYFSADKLPDTDLNNYLKRIKSFKEVAFLASHTRGYFSLPVFLPSSFSVLICLSLTFASSLDPKCFSHASYIVSCLFQAFPVYTKQHFPYAVTKLSS